MISVVIVNFNTRDLLRACLRSVRKAEPRAEVIVVDNGSKDGSAAMVQKEFGKTGRSGKVRLVANKRNRGFAAANNQGFAKARGDVIVMLNSDTEVPKGALSKLARELERHPEVGVVAPQLRNAAGEVQQSASWRAPGLLTLFLEYTLLNRVLYRMLPAVRYPGKQLLTRAELGKRRDVGDLLGACMVFRKELLKEIGTLDERFFVFLEETDFNARVRDAGYGLVYLPTVRVLHHWGGSIDSDGSLAKRFSLFYPSLYRFFRKRHGSLYVGMARLAALILLPVSLILILLSLIPIGIVSLLTGKSFFRAVTNQLPVLWGALRWHWGIR
ncbi:MAG: glycosyltransferase family 2 protein [bacterium]|nr:glycosyltransferase family 2 protein [bacterium]